VRLVLLGTLACEQEAVLRRKLHSALEILPVPDPAPDPDRRAALEAAELMITLRYDRSMPRAPLLRFVQAGGAGYDEIELSYLPPGTVVANAYGHEEAVAEYVLLAMLLWSTRFLEIERSFRAGSWALGGRTGGPLRDELGGKTVGLIGFGRIARAVARRARAFAARVIACARTVPAAAELAWGGPLGAVDQLLAESDFVVIASGLGPETSGLLDRSHLARMKPTGVLVNVSRGAIVDEEALYRALEGGAIGGAVIDTWYRYPTPAEPEVRPSRFPFHELPNVHMTPHSAAWTAGMIDRRWTMIAENIDRVARGEAPVNVVYRAPDP
jgi:phosphoglycerate dehydrogenase-like enzyme